MKQRIYRAFKAPKRVDPSWEERWLGCDKGLITCWEVGRETRDKNPELAKKAKKGELPLLLWKGGVAKKIKQLKKYGTLNYLAQWQGLRGDDLDIDLSKEMKITCSKTGIEVIYTSNPKRRAQKSGNMNTK
ncbi:MAG: hypothetical protein ACR2P7_06370 [bacterium]